MTRIEMIDNLLDSYTTRELKALADKLGIDYHYAKSHQDMVYLTYTAVNNILFDPGGWHEKFNKLTEERDNVS